MNGHAPDRALDVDPDLEQPEPERLDAQSFEKWPAQNLDQCEGRGREQPVRLYGSKDVASGAVERDIMIESLEPILDLAPAAVARVDSFRPVAQVGQAEVRIRPRRAIVESDDLRIGHESPGDILP